MSAFLQSLADVLDVSPAEARAALEAFAGRLRERLADESAVTLGGLGTFRREGGRTVFEADESVALVVNHRYAGMEPIALTTGAPPRWQAGLPDDEHPLGPPPPEVFEDATPEEEAVTAAQPEADFGTPEVEDEAVWTDVPPPGDTPELPPLFASDETLMALRDASRDLDAPASEQADEWAARMIDEEHEAPAEPEPDADDLPPPPLHPASMPVEAHLEMPQDYEPEEEEEVPAALPPEPPDEPIPQAEPAVPVEPTGPVEPAVPVELPHRPGPRDRAEEPERRFPWVPALLLLALVGVVVAVLVLRDPSPTLAVPPVAAPDTSLVADTTAAALPADTAATSEQPPADDPLRSTAPVVSGQGYTIVVGGATSQQAAEDIANTYRQQGFRTGVLPGRTGSGTAIYRVGVGQFGSIAEAQQALNGLGGAVPSDAWIHNLR